MEEKGFCLCELKQVDIKQEQKFKKRRKLYFHSSNEKMKICQEMMKINQMIKLFKI